MSAYYSYGYYYELDDPLYVFAMVLMAVALIVTLVAQIKVKTTFSKYSNAPSSLTGAQAAEKMLAANGVFNVKVERISGSLTDHFDPTANVIRLSDDVYDKATVAAVGVACHEAGHALQYASNYAPIKFRTSIVPVTRFGSMLAIPLILLGFFMEHPAIIGIGIAFYALSTLFQLVTLPVEFNASKRAMATIRNYSILYDPFQISGAKSVLTAAAMTYLGALLSSIAQLLRLIAIFAKRD